MPFRFGKIQAAGVPYNDTEWRRTSAGRNLRLPTKLYMQNYETGGLDDRISRVLARLPAPPAHMERRWGHHRLLTRVSQLV